MDKVLILDGQSPAATECILALTPRCEVDLATCSGRCGLPARHVRRILCQPFSPDALREWVQELFLRERYQLVIPSTEVSLHSLKSDELDPTLRARMVIPDEESIEIALNKQRTVDLARQLGIPVPASEVVSSLSNLRREARYPTVIKPLHSKLLVQDRLWSVGPHICRDAESRLAACVALLPYTAVLEQEYFRGQGVGVEVLFEHGQLCWWFAHERIHALPVTGGASTYRRSIEPPKALLRATCVLLSRLRWHGVAMVEFKVAQDGEYRLMEINPRLWGSLPLAVAAGMDFPDGLLRLSRGESPGPQPDYRRDLYMRHVARDLVWYAQSWKERRNPLLVKPLRIADGFGLLRPLIGSERWDFFRWRRPGIWWTSTRTTFASLHRNRRRKAAARSAAANWSKLQSAWRCGRTSRVLVLCRGNICRSPVVERLLSQAGVEVKSAGFLPASGRAPPTDWSRVVQRILGIDLSGHRASTVDSGVLEWAELILLMDAANWNALFKAHPEAISKAVLLGTAACNVDPDSPEIHDPYELENCAMQAIALTLKFCVQELLDQRAVYSPVLTASPEPI